jgi:hypothetical protein
MSIVTHPVAKSTPTEEVQRISQQTSTTQTKSESQHQWKTSPGAQPGTPSPHPISRIPNQRRGARCLPAGISCATRVFDRYASHLRMRSGHGYVRGLCRTSRSALPLARSQDKTARVAWGSAMVKGRKGVSGRFGCERRPGATFEVTSMQSRSVVRLR